MAFHLLAPLGANRAGIVEHGTKCMTQDKIKYYRSKQDLMACIDLKLPYKGYKGPKVITLGGDGQKTRRIKIQRVRYTFKVR